MKKEFYDFLKNDHTSMIENMNRISDDLLKAYWYFLATIAAVGMAYYKVIHYDLIPVGIVIISLVGNIVFWKISEYSLSHGFLFRYVQVKTAKIEKKIYRGIDNQLYRTIKDPTKIENFIRPDGNKYILDMNHLIPDQFIPLYWASLWVIIINTVAGCFLLNLRKNISCWWYFSFLFISFPFISKLWRYYLYKIRKFIEHNCEFDIKTQYNENFFRFPSGKILNPCINMFLVPILGLLIHFLKYSGLIEILKKKLIIEITRKSKTCFVVHSLCDFTHIMILLYIIV